jgi:hypothetical protein
MNKLRSKKAWTATAMLLFFILKNYFDYEIPNFDGLLDLLLFTGTTWGIWRNLDDIGGNENESIRSDKGIKPKRTLNNLTKK